MIELRAAHRDQFLIQQLFRRRARPRAPAIADRQIDAISTKVGQFGGGVQMQLGLGMAGMEVRQARQRS